MSQYQISYHIEKSVIYDDMTTIYASSSIEAQTKLKSELYDDLDIDEKITKLEITNIKDISYKYYLFTIWLDSPSSTIPKKSFTFPWRIGSDQDINVKAKERAEKQSNKYKALYNTNLYMSSYSFEEIDYDKMKLYNLECD